MQVQGAGDGWEMEDGRRFDATKRQGSSKMYRRACRWTGGIPKPCTNNSEA